MGRKTTEDLGALCDRDRRAARFSEDTFAQAAELREFGWTIREIAEAVGFSRARVSRALRHVPRGEEVI